MPELISVSWPVARSLGTITHIPLRNRQAPIPDSGYSRFLRYSATHSWASPSSTLPSSPPKQESTSQYQHSLSRLPQKNTQTSHALHLARSGITGLVLLGSTSKAVHLTRTERVAQIKHVWAALSAGGYEDCPLIAGTATNVIEETMELLNESAAAGAGCGLVLAPGYFAAATSQEGIIALYKGVAEGSSIPVMIFVSPLLPPQDPALPVELLPLPRRQQQYKTPPSIFRSLAAHPNIVDGKLSQGDISIHA
ncbi:aldolase [Choiromyces venosus 120613-1]|uniref:Aldolase n=1 Tax=Choiromyces venosus 120613-1 TaxID=1336337 RepID=A0A3N4J2U7_9PEZI|nr:aldolase [Choiromyces venosus 120613-1]